MTKFVVNRPVITSVPSVTVDAGLPEGRHRFQLVVVDSAGNQSEPAIVTVTIRGRTLPVNP